MEVFQESLESIRTLIVNQGKTLSNVVQLLSGNPIDKKDEGMIGRVAMQEAKHEELEKKVAALDEDRKRQKWTMKGVVIACTAMFTVIEIILKLLV
jgi:hypothetical protein